MKAIHSVAVILLAVLLSTSGAAQQTPTAPLESYTTLASNISEIGAAGLVQLDIDILRWTDEAENERFMTAFNEKGPDGLVAALQKAPVAARIKTPGTLAYDLHYAVQVPGKDGTRRILLINDRWIGFGEAYDRSRSLDYPFTLIDMKLDASGRGEGQLFIATKIMRSGNLLILENFATRPVTLGSIKPRP
jgi:hypothetical protein